MAFQIAREFLWWVYRKQQKTEDIEKFQLFMRWSEANTPNFYLLHQPNLSYQHLQQTTPLFVF